MFQTPSGRHLRIELLGAIPKNGSILRNTATGRFNMSLQRMCRFETILARARSVLQLMAKTQLSWSSSQWGYFIYYPSFTRRYEVAGQVQPDSINDGAYIFDPTDIIQQFIDRPLLHDFLSLRPIIPRLLPEKIWVTPEARPLLRYLSYHCFNPREPLGPR